MLAPLCSWSWNDRRRHMKRAASLAYSRPSFSTVWLALLLLCTPLAQSAVVGPPVPPQEAQVIAQEAYVYLYPLILMDITRKQLTNLDARTSPFGGPANVFTNIRTF